MLWALKIKATEDLSPVVATDESIHVAMASYEPPKDGLGGKGELWLVKDGQETLIGKFGQHLSQMEVKFNIDSDDENVQFRMKGNGEINLIGYYEEDMSEEGSTSPFSVEDSDEYSEDSEPESGSDEGESLNNKFTGLKLNISTGLGQPIFGNLEPSKSLKQ